MCVLTHDDLSCVLAGHGCSSDVRSSDSDQMTQAPGIAYEAEDIAGYLWGLAEGFMIQTPPLPAPAIRCLEAVLQSPRRVFPPTEIKVRLRVAELLLEHADNIDEASSHLQRAVCFRH